MTILERFETNAVLLGLESVPKFRNFTSTVGSTRKAIKVSHDQMRSGFELLDWVSSHEGLSYHVEISDGDIYIVYKRI